MCIYIKNAERKSSIDISFVKNFFYLCRKFVCEARQTKYRYLTIKARAG